MAIGDDWTTIFNANAPVGDPGSYGAQQLRQRIALDLMTKKRAYPKTFGEGLAAIGDSLGEIGTTRALMAQQAAYEKYQKEHPGPTAADLLKKTSDAGDVTDQPRVADASVFPDPSTAQASIPQSMVAQLGPAPDAYNYKPTAMAASDTASDGPPVTGISPVAAAPPPRRDAIASLLTNGSASLDGAGGPQVNPTQPGVTTPPSNLPLSAASLGGPPEAQRNRAIATDISPQPSPAPGAQVAQAGPAPSIPQINRITPPVTMPGTEMPTQPPNEPMNRAEIEGYKMLDLGQRLQDPTMTQRGTTLIEAGKAARTKQDADAMKQYELQMQTYHARVLAQEAAERGAKATQQGIINAPPTGGPAGAVDQRLLGTPQSPQRNGIIKPEPVPYNVKPEEWATKQGEDAAKAAQAYEKALPQFNEVIKTIQLARNHPGQYFGVGLTSEIAKRFHGTSTADFDAVMKQIGGENFLSAYNTLRGGGSIANVEGNKAQEARGRVATSQSREGFHGGLNDLETSVRTDLETIQRKMQVPVTAWQRGPNDPPAPDLHQVDERPGKVGLYEYLGGNPALDGSYRRVR